MSTTGLYKSPTMYKMSFCILYNLYSLEPTKTRTIEGGKINFDHVKESCRGFVQSLLMLSALEHRIRMKHVSASIPAIARARSLFLVMLLMCIRRSSSFEKDDVHGSRLAVT
jgi:hypothetical protein